MRKEKTREEKVKKFTKDALENGYASTNIELTDRELKQVDSLMWAKHRKQSLDTGK